MRELLSPAVTLAYAALSTLLLTSYAHAMPQVSDLGHVSGDHLVAMSQAHDVSDDGQIVVGSSTFILPSTNNRHRIIQTAFQWTPSTGIQALPYLAGGGVLAAAHAVTVTPNRNITVGASDGRAANGTRFWAHATLWENNQPPRDLGTLPGGNESAAYNISQQGSRIVGYSKNQQGTMRAVLWDREMPPEDLGTLGGRASIATGISQDGSYIVGATHEASQRSRAFIWTKQNGMKDLGTLPGTKSAQATAISANGNVIIGYSAQRIGDWIAPQTDEPIKGVIWHRTSGQMQEIVNTLGGLTTLPLGVSNDGRIVVGIAKDAHDTTHAFRWTPEQGMTAESTLPAHLRMQSAHGLSNDGRYSVGRLTQDDRVFRTEWR